MRTGTSTKRHATSLKAIRSIPGNSSSPGKVVFDPFDGPGSTMIAAEKSYRRARLIEVDPKFVAVILKRWETFTGRKATLETDGRCFEDVSFASGHACGYRRFPQSE